MPNPTELTRVIILAWHRACLIPVFGEAALSRLVRLATSGHLAVTVWLTPELSDALSLRPRQAAGAVVWRVVDFARLSEAGAKLGTTPGNTLLVLPGNSVWDRVTFRAALENQGSRDFLAAYRLTASEVPDTVERWRHSGLPESSGTGSLPVFLQGPADAAAAEASLSGALAAATEGSDGLLARWVDRPLSRRLSPVLASRRVAPNAVTLAGSSIGCLGALLLAQAGYVPHLLGALLFLVAVVLDGVDGEVARLTLRETRFGHYLDIITDNLVHMAVFCGIALGLHRTAPDDRHLYALALLLGGFGLSALAANFMVERGDPEKEGWAPLLHRLVTTLNSRDFAYLVFLLALADRLAWFLWGAALGSNVFAATLFLLPRYYRQKPAKSA